MNMAAPTPSGTQITIAQKVTRTEPISRGSTPNFGGSEIGSHSRPNRTLLHRILAEQRERIPQEEQKDQEHENDDRKAAELDAPLDDEFADSPAAGADDDLARSRGGIELELTRSSATVAPTGTNPVSMNCVWPIGPSVKSMNSLTTPCGSPSVYRYSGLESG